MPDASECLFRRLNLAFSAIKNGYRCPRFARNGGKRTHSFRQIH